MSTYLDDLDRDRLPNHVGIVMDGNGRWAKLRGLPRTDGHTAGEEAMWDTVVGANELGMGWLTMFAFSSENWKRPKAEVAFLMGFNRGLLRRRRDELHRMNVRVRFLGRRDWKVPRSVLKEMEISEELTRRQHRHDADDRVQLRRAGRGRRCGEAARSPTTTRAAQGREAHARVDLEPAVPPRHAGPRPDHPHQRRGADLATSCCGRPRTASCTSRRCTGRTSTASTCTRRSATTRSGRDGSARSPRTTRASRVRLPDEARRVVESDALAHVTTIDPDGTTADHARLGRARGRRTWSSPTLPDQRKLRNLRRDPRVTISIQTERVNPFGLHEYLVLYGSALVTEGGRTGGPAAARPHLPRPRRHLPADARPAAPATSRG